ncbi:hypothetical protein K2D_41620 [Planctomycetes bacterium K2D]|uniref:Uncharacterized protein n=1 Tax=Botrimarina mediterranea TaxID=2528022 RepID=A0A518KDR6_9BACT|nr:hypothetical protein Spa11_41610 [Botrimarina mediterranea]QDV80533.1 hypothetical protein K2D_41620 [Planctomycetes bacterium K2D]
MQDASKVDRVSSNFKEDYIWEPTELSVSRLGEVTPVMLRISLDVGDL